MEVEALLADDPRAHFRRGTIVRRPVQDEDVLIDIHYAGICHSDYHTVKAEWGGPKHYPMVPGHEIAGFVEQVGSKVTKFKVGDKVGVGCFVDSCRTCATCKSGDENYCPQFILTYDARFTDDYIAKHRVSDNARVTFGGYSQKIVVAQHYVLSVPDSLPFEYTAPLLCAGITMYSPLRYYGPQTALKNPKDFKVAIIGFGGLGDMGAKLADKMNFSVTVVSTSERKREYVENDLKVNFLNSSNSKEFQASFKQFDLALCTIPVKYDLDLYLQLMKNGSKFCILGVPPNKLDFSPGAIIFNRLSICGSVIGGIRETQEMLDFCAKHEIYSEVEKISAKEVNRAYSEMSHNSANKQRFVIDIKNTLRKGGDDKNWEVEKESVKECKESKVNDNAVLLSSENPENELKLKVAGKTYFPKTDSWK